MSIAIDIEWAPLDVDVDGAIRVGGTRVTLETVVTAFQQDATAEEIAQQYDALDLADLYAVIGYYLRRKSEVDEYVPERVRESAAAQQAHETRFDPAGIRDRLLARRAAKAVG